MEDYDDQPAGFGPAYPIAGIKVHFLSVHSKMILYALEKGYVVPVRPLNGCSKVDPPPSVSISNYKWIALIQRTRDNISCDFDLKVKIIFSALEIHFFVLSQVKNAQDANFSAVIIYNYEDILITMGPHGRSKDFRCKINRKNGFFSFD